MKLIKIASFLTILLLLAACGGEEPEAEATIPAEAADITIPPTPTLPPPVVSGEVEVEEGSEPAVIEAESAPDFLGPWPEDEFGYGIQSHAVVGDPAFAMDVIKNQLGLDWVKVQLEWPLIQPDPETRQWFFYDGVVDEASKRGLHLMFSVVGAPAWTRAIGGENGPPDDYALYATFITEMLQRYQGRVHAIEVWNEQNIVREWNAAEGLSAERYVALLAQAHEAIKANSNDIIVISGALAPTGIHDENSRDDFIFLDELLAAGLLKYSDCVGVHHNGYNIGPDVAFDQTGGVAEAATAFFRGPFDNVHHSWSFKTTVDIYAEKVQAVDPAKKVCVTEFGWASSEGYDEYPKDFGYAVDNSLEEQAQFIVQAFQQMHDSGNVWLAFLFNYDFGNKGQGPTDDPVPYSLIDINGLPRPAFGAVAEMAKPR